MASTIDQSPNTQPAFAKVVYNAFSRSVHSYFHPLVVTSRVSRNLFQSLLAYLLTLVPGRRIQEATDVQSIHEEDRERVLKQIVREALTQLGDQEAMRMNSINETLKDARRHFETLLLSRVIATTKDREKVMSDELRRKRDSARQSIRALEEELEERWQRKELLSKALDGNEDDAWMLQQAMTWIEKLMLSLNEELTKATEEINNLRRELENSVLEQDLERLLAHGIPLQDRHHRMVIGTTSDKRDRRDLIILEAWRKRRIRDWEGLSVEQERIDKFKDELRASIKKDRETQLEDTQNRERLLTGNLDRLQKRLDLLNWGMARLVSKS